MVRLLHTSDWHLGRFLHGKSLLEDQVYILDRFIELIDRTQPHAVLIAGDVFDRPFPPEAAVSLFDRFLYQVVEQRGVRIFLIPGNHDSCERLGFAQELLRGRGLTIFSKPEDALRAVKLTGDHNVEVAIYGIPFVEPPLIARYLERDDIRSPDEALQALCQKIKEVHGNTLPSVLLCHAFVTGSEISDSEKDIFIGGSSNVDAKVFCDFTYTALGHLHKPQSAGAKAVRYSGSLLPYSKSEVDHKKSVTEIRIASDHSTELEFHELPRLRNLRYIENELDQLLLLAKDDPAPNDYIIAGFTDSAPVLDAYSRLRLHYPNLLHIARAGGFKPTELPALRRGTEGISELDQFADFFRETTGDDLSDEERYFLIEALQELNQAEKDGPNL